MGTGRIPGTGYALRRVVVATDLVTLRGPVRGRWQLPLHLDAPERAVYDFADLAPASESTWPQV